MFAYSYRRYGAPDVLEKVHVARPTPRPNDVLVEIYATTVNSADWRLRSLTMPEGLGWAGRLGVGVFGPRKPILGTEFSGVIVATGIDVDKYAVGDSVIGFPGADLGAHAEFIAMPQDGKLTRKPAAISYITAAAIPFGGTTAYDFLVSKAKLQSGETILINGASGTTGSACVQIAKHIGATVTAVCSAKNATLVRGLGADRVVDYQTIDFTAEGIQYDVIVDTIGTAPWVRSKKALRSGGRMVLIAGHANDMIFGSLKARLAGKRLISGAARETPAILQQVVDLAKRGAFRPVIDSCYTFDNMIAAHRRVDTGHKVGSVVVAVADAKS